MVARFVIFALAALKVAAAGPCECLIPPPCSIDGGLRHGDFAYGGIQGGADLIGAGHLGAGHLGVGHLGAGHLGVGHLGAGQLGAEGVLSGEGHILPGGAAPADFCGDLNLGAEASATSSIVGGDILPAPISSPIAPSQCLTHRLVPVTRQVVEECITNVPVVRKSVRHQEESITRQVPVVERSVSQQEEKILRHVPVTQKRLRNVIETRTRHVPVIKTRSRTVVEPYTTHVPITEKYSRPVEEVITKHVPVTETRVRPIVSRRTRLVPVVEKRLRPIVDTQVQNIPIKKKYIRNLVEQRVRAVRGPCYPCPPGLPIGQYDSAPISSTDASASLYASPALAGATSIADSSAFVGASSLSGSYLPGVIETLPSHGASTISAGASDVSSLGAVDATTSGISPLSIAPSACPCIPPPVIC